MIGNDDVAVSTRGLTKRYGSDRPALDGVDLTVRRGEVFGLLGPNGAGKTTLLRVLLGLTRPTSGSVTVLGGAPKTFSGPHKVGALVETPAFYPYLSGRTNLKLRARLLRGGGRGGPKGGDLEGRGVEEALGLVGLGERAGDRVRKYSLGMRHRLGIAAALLGEPELLLLDEPTNGLDPRGIAEVRRLIRTLGSRGDVTVVLSSHLLGEVENTCTRVGIVSHGRLVHESGIEEIRARHRSVLVRADSLENAARAAERAGFRVAEASEGSLCLSGGEADVPLLAERLVEAGVRVKEIRLEHDSLERTYLDSTGEGRPA